MLKTLSLFAGVGGIDLGLERTGGFSTVAFCEIDKHCHKVLNKHWPDVPILHDINKVHVADGCLMEEDNPDVGYLDNKIDVICGGSPCQGISRGGKQRGIIYDDRSSLWKQYARLVGEIRPRFVIFENVECITEAGLGVVVNDLTSLRYICEWGCVSANSLGYPHQRQRLYLVSYPSSLRSNDGAWEGRLLQADEKWESESYKTLREGCEPESSPLRPLFSARAIDRIRSTYPDERAAVSSLHRVTDGVPAGLHETARKQRIKQMGNSVVPRMFEILGKRILEIEKERT